MTLLPPPPTTSRLSVSFLLSVGGIVVVHLLAGLPTVWCWTTSPLGLPHVPTITSQSHRRPTACATRSAAATASGGLELEVWVDLRPLEQDLVSSSSSSSTPSSSSSLSFLDGADAAIISEKQASDKTIRQTLSSFSASMCIAKTPTSSIGDGDTTIPRLYHDNNGEGQPMGAIVDVTTSAGQDAAVGLIGSLEWIVISCNKRETDADEGWIMIPAENLISACQGTGTKIAAMVDNAGDVGGLADALQLGVDALCVDATRAVRDEKLWAACLDARKAKLAAKGQMEDDASTPTTSGPSIVQGSCKRLATPSGKSTVLADRVCIDLVQSLKPTEGCWLGSSAKIMALVLSEAAQSSFVPSRPFRINAGPVHSYVLMGDGVSTKYLSELRAGDEVLVFDVEMETERAVAVWRLKEEVRPCIQIELSVDGSTAKGQVFVQQAETVRLGKRKGEAAFVRATGLESIANDDVAVEEEILLRVTELGTHVGKAYSGKVQEK